MDSSFFEKFEQAVLEASRSNDPVDMAAYLDEKFVGVGVIGSVFDKAEFLARVGSNTVVHDSEIIKVRVINEGDFAVVIADWKVKMNHDSSILDGLIRVSRTWVRRPNGWKILNFHISDARMGAKWVDIQTEMKKRG